MKKEHSEGLSRRSGHEILLGMAVLKNAIYEELHNSEQEIFSRRAVVFTIPL